MTDVRRVRRVRKVLLIAAAVLISCVGAGGWAWEVHMEDRMVARNFGVVDPGLVYRSGQISRHMIEPTLRRHHIAVIINLNGHYPDDPDYQAEVAAAGELGIDYHHYALRGDGTGDIEQYIKALIVLEEAVRSGRPTLFHCAAGSDRAGGMTAFYRLLIQKRPFDDVLAEMRRYDWDPADNEGRLVAYLNEHLPTVAARLLAAGTIDAMPAAEQLRFVP